MKLSDLHQKLTDINDYPNLRSKYEIYDIISAAANIILLLDELIDARKKYIASNNESNEYLGQFNECKVALLDACKGGDT